MKTVFRFVGLALSYVIVAGVFVYVVFMGCLVFLSIFR